MKKLIVFWKQLVILVVSFGLTGFLFCSSDDDDKSCGDAVTNAVNVYVNAMNEGDITLVQLCDEFQEDMTTEQYDQCLLIDSPEELDAFKSEIINILSQECASADDPWPQSLIDCLAGASTIEAIETCVAAVEK